MVKDLQTETARSLEEGQVIQSIRRSRRSLEQRKGELHFRLGRLFAARQDDQKALESYRQALRFDPELEDYKQAVRQWEQLLQRR